MKHRRLVFLLATISFPIVARGQDQSDRIAGLERKLAEAKNSVATLQQTIEVLSNEVQALRKPILASPVAVAELPSVPSKAPEDPVDSLRKRTLRPDLGQDERGAEISARPELFIQSRFQALPIAAGNQQNAPSNFSITRMETRWSGRISDEIGMGFEIQYHPAPAGAAVELVNDAFVEYYANRAITVRAGQFVKPFGFDIQQSSGVRESPERGMFAGYFFPGQRDRGVMVTAKLDSLGDLWHGTQLFAGAFNGNRFFVDNNRQLNYNVRLRKVFDAVPLAVGVSVQLGRQLLPEGVHGNSRENLFGADVQWAWKRLGVRAEFVGGNMPSTLLSLQPEFAPAFRPGVHSSGGSVFSSFRVTRQSEAYARYDRFNRDPVSGKNVRSFNVGYFRYLGDNSRIGVDYQFKNRVSFNDDLLNTRLQIVWNVMY